MTTETRLRPAPVIDETARLLTEHYVLPETAEQLAGLGPTPSPGQGVAARWSRVVAKGLG